MVVNTLRKLLPISVAVALGAGCASLAPSVLTQRGFKPLSPQATTTALPALNTAAVAQVGDSMITGGKTYTRPAIHLAQPVSHHGTSKGLFIIQIPAGILIASGVSPGPVRGVFFEAQQPLQFSSAGNAVVKGGIFVPDKPGLTSEIYWHATDTGIPLVDPDNSIQFERSTHEDWQSDSFRRELIYNGRAGATIKLLYREFSEEKIRPAFSQEVTYDLAQGETIGFKGARFQVLAADNVSIKYMVLHHFD
jgi:hypothetical protein